MVYEKERLMQLRYTIVNTRWQMIEW